MPFLFRSSFHFEAFSLRLQTWLLSLHSLMQNPFGRMPARAALSHSKSFSSTLKSLTPPQPAHKHNKYPVVRKGTLVALPSKYLISRRQPPLLRSSSLLLTQVFCDLRQAPHSYQSFSLPYFPGVLLIACRHTNFDHSQADARCRQRRPSKRRRSYWAGLATT